MSINDDMYFAKNEFMKMKCDKKILQQVLKEDLMRFGNTKPKLKDRILHNEVFYIYQLIRHLRYIEYYRNSYGIGKLFYFYHWYRYKHLGFKLKMAIYPGTTGGGFKICHAGSYTHVGPNVRIGKNCTFVSGVVFGNKTEVEDNRSVTVGDNCYFGNGVTILGPVHIGNDVTVGAHAVVTKDIPDNAVVVGVPAKIIRIKE